MFDILDWIDTYGVTSEQVETLTHKEVVTYVKRLDNELTHLEAIEVANELVGIEELY